MNFYIKCNRYGNWTLYQGAKSTGPGWSASVAADDAVKTLKIAGISTVRVTVEITKGDFETGDFVVSSHALWSELFIAMGRNVRKIKIEAIENAAERALRIKSAFAPSKGGSK